MRIDRHLRTQSEALGHEARRLTFAALLLLAHLPLTHGKPLLPDSSSVRRAPVVTEAGAAQAGGRVSEARDGSRAPSTARLGVLPTPPVPYALLARLAPVVRRAPRGHDPGPPAAARAPPARRC